MSNFIQFYNAIIWIGNHLRSPLLLAIRLFWGYAFLTAGLGKFSHMAATVSSFQDLGIPLAHFNAYLVASVETLGGLLLMLGWFTRLAAIPLVILMIVAYLTAHLQSVETIFQDPDAFVKQAPFNFLLASLILLAFGPGKLSFDYLFGLDNHYD